MTFEKQGEISIKLVVTLENGQQYTTSLMKINVKSPDVEENDKTDNKLEAFFKNETLLTN